MTDSNAHTTADLCARLNGELHGPGDLTIAGIAALDEAGPREVTFIADAAHARRWPDSAAAAAIVTRRLLPVDHDPSRRALIVVDDAEMASMTLLQFFAPERPRPAEGVHPGAVIDPTATLGEQVRIGPFVTVGPRAVIGDEVVLHAGVHIYADVHIGAESELHAGCVVRERCRLGRRVILHQNVSIGADGFGYRPAADGRGLAKMPHVGTVVIEDGVEIGAGSCIDRAKFSATVIGEGTKIDNLVQIAHNCRVGRHCVIAALTGVAGSVRIGDGVQIGAQAGIAEHVRVGDGARVGGAVRGDAGRSARAGGARHTVERDASDIAAVRECS